MKACAHVDDEEDAEHCASTKTRKQCTCFRKHTLAHKRMRLLKMTNAFVPGSGVALGIESVADLLVPRPSKRFRMPSSKDTWPMNVSTDQRTPSAYTIANPNPNDADQIHPLQPHLQPQETTTANRISSRSVLVAARLPRACQGRKRRVTKCIPAGKLPISHFTLVAVASCDRVAKELNLARWQRRRLHRFCDNARCVARRLDAEPVECDKVRDRVAAVPIRLGGFKNLNIVRARSKRNPVAKDWVIMRIFVGDAGGSEGGDVLVGGLARAIDKDDERVGLEPRVLRIAAWVWGRRKMLLGQGNGDCGSSAQREAGANLAPRHVKLHGSPVGLEAADVLQAGTSPAANAPAK